VNLFLPSFPVLLHLPSFPRCLCNSFFSSMRTSNPQCDLFFFWSGKGRSNVVIDLTNKCLLCTNPFTPYWIATSPSPSSSFFLVRRFPDRVHLPLFGEGLFPPVIVLRIVVKLFFPTFLSSPEPENLRVFSFLPDFGIFPPSSSPAMGDICAPEGFPENDEKWKIPVLGFGPSTFLISSIRRCSSSCLVGYCSLRDCMDLVLSVTSPPPLPFWYL